MKILRTFAVTALLALAGVACGSGDTSSTDTAGSTTAGETAADTAADVEVADFEFSPAKISIEAGEAVAWTNADAVLHTVTSGSITGAENKADGDFEGELAKRGATFSHTFEEPGTFTYFCSQHNVMNGTIEVKESN